MDKYKELTGKGVAGYLSALEEVSWFRYSKIARAEVEERLFKTEDPADYVLCLYDLWFDAEGFEDDESYSWLLERIQLVTGLDFKLNVTYQQETNSVEITINGAGGDYHYAVAMESDWIDESFIEELINNRVLPGEGVASQFIALPPTDQTVQFVYIPSAAYDNAIAKGIIPSDMGYFMD